MRLDAADSSWHLSTPTPYDPPLTYGGWNQCRSLGVRIAKILNTREELALSPSDDHESIISQDFSQLDVEAEESRPKKRRRIKHKVVIHSSPFLRCLQTSVAIAAGMAQYNPTVESVGGGKKTAASKMHSASPRLRATEAGHASPNLPPISEPKHTDFAHTIARKALLHEHKRHRKSKLRVDAFLGEWLNPSYFDSITPPPPSAMMLATAKAELMENEAVEIFTPATTAKAPVANSSLWGGSTNGSNSRPSTPEGESPDSPTPPSLTSPSRSRASTTTENGTGTANQQPFSSTLPKPELATYHPPQPHYALSASSQIPRGYVAHARNACTNVDYAWDSSKPPQDWGDGGEFGEEWSHMHKRIRRGLNRMMCWYGKEGDERGEDALGLDQTSNSDTAANGTAKDGEEEEREDLVVIMVTHGAGCNALIGALTSQPVLLDVGMASLTLAVRREDAPFTTLYAAETEPGGTRSESPEMVMSHGRRRGSLDMGLSAVYEMKVVASTDHLRSTAAASPSMRPIDSTRDGLAVRNRFLDRDREPPRSNTNSALGTIRRPSTTLLAPHAAGSADRSSSMPATERLPALKGGLGLWTPPTGGRSPFLRPQAADEKPWLFSSLSERKVGGEEAGKEDEGMQLLDFSNTPPDSRPGTSGGDGSQKKDVPAAVGSATTNGTTKVAQVDGAADERDGSKDEVAKTPKVVETPSAALNKHKGLWGSRATGEAVVRRGREMPKRRWTVDQE